MRERTPKLPPHSIDAEQSVLGGLLLDNRPWDDLAGELLPEDFYREDHRLIYAAICDLVGGNRPCDFVTLSQHLRSRGQLDDAGGMAYLGELTNNVLSAANVRAYAAIVREQSMLRAMIAAGGDIADLGFRPDGRAIGELVDIAEQKVFSVRNGAKRSGQQGYTMADLMTQVEADLEAASKLGDDEVVGLPTGFVDLDAKINGLRPGQVVILAGRPGMGKTTIAQQIADHIGDSNRGIPLIFSMEMPGKELGLRSLSAASGVSLDRLIRGRLTQKEMDAVTEAGGRLRQRKTIVDDTGGLSPLELRARARRVARRGNLGLIVVDYLQLMSIPGYREGRVNEVSEISRSMKALAKELNVPIIVLSQLNRGVEQRDNKRPRMSDLRESGGIEQDADLILFVYRDEVYNEHSPDRGTAEIIVAKQRNGALGTVRLATAMNSVRFLNLRPDWRPASIPQVRKVLRRPIGLADAL